VAGDGTAAAAEGMVVPYGIRVRVWGGRKGPELAADLTVGNGSVDHVGKSVGDHDRHPALEGRK